MARAYCVSSLKPLVHHRVLVAVIVVVVVIISTLIITVIIKDWCESTSDGGESMQWRMKH